MEEILKQILSKLDIIEDGQKGLIEGQQAIITDLQELNRKTSVILNQTANLTEFKTEVISDLKELKKDLAFVCHKEFETEKDVFNIKKHLEIIK